MEYIHYAICISRRSNAENKNHSRIHRGEIMPRIDLEKTETFKKINKVLTVEEIIQEYLKKNGYDGLCYIYDDIVECTCQNDYLFYCGEIEHSCKAWKKENK